MLIWDIPREELVVLTGLSGSGNSLAFDTIYAEGQRRLYGVFVLLCQMCVPGTDGKADVERMEGLPPAIYWDQKPQQEPQIYGRDSDDLRLFPSLYARVGTSLP